jgi:hypothetical protein
MKHRITNKIGNASSQKSINSKIDCIKITMARSQKSACNESETTKQTVKLYVIKTLLRFLLPDIL